MNPILIKRRTRPDIEISSLDDLLPHLKDASKRFRRLNELNVHLFDHLFGRTYDSANTFKKELKVVFGIKGKGHRKDDSLLISAFGWTQEEVEEANQFSHSPMSPKYRGYIGMSLEEIAEIVKAEGKRRSNRCVEYWTSRGYSEEESRVKVSEVQSGYSAQCDAETKAENSPLSMKYKGYDGLDDAEKQWRIVEIQRCRSERCPEHWVLRGYSQEEADRRVAEYQRSRLDGKSEEELSQIYTKRAHKNSAPINFYWRQNGEFVPGHFYVIELRPGLYKIGISIKGAYSRYRPKDLLGRKVLVNDLLESAFEAFRIEQVLRRQFTDKIKKENAVGPFGWTEIIETDVDTLMSKYRTLLENKEETQLMFDKIGKPK